MRTAVFVPDDPVLVNGDLLGKSQLWMVEDSSEEIVLLNPGITHADAFVLGGPEPAERLIVQGPFVMNTREEIGQAVEDFEAGRLGRIPPNALMPHVADPAPVRTERTGI